MRRGDVQNKTAELLFIVQIFMDFPAYDWKEGKYISS